MEKFYKVESNITNDLDVQIKGVKYFLPAGGELKNIPEDHMIYWKDRLHPFLKFVKMNTESQAFIDNKVKAKDVEVKKEDIIAPVVSTETKEDVVITPSAPTAPVAKETKKEEVKASK